MEEIENPLLQDVYRIDKYNAWFSFGSKYPSVIYLETLRETSWNINWG